MKRVILPLILFALAVSWTLPAWADVPAKATQAADRFFAALKAKDYKAATADFSPKMLEFLPPDRMKANQENNIEPVIGEYVSHVYKSSEESGGFVSYFYHAKFTKDDDVTVKLVFAKDDPTFRITGLWFDSEKLRAQKSGSSLPAAEKEKAEKAIGAVVESYFKAIKTKDYKAATKDFSAEMLKALPPEKLKDEVEKNEGPVIGDYVSHQYQSFGVEGKFLIYVCLAKFMKDDHVQVKFVFGKDDPAYKISGLWYDSPKLRAAKK
jgi:hypothetical protein